MKMNVDKDLGDCLLYGSCPNKMTETVVIVIFVVLLVIQAFIANHYNHRNGYAAYHSTLSYVLFEALFIGLLFIVFGLRGLVIWILLIVIFALIIISVSYMYWNFNVKKSNKN